MVVQGTHTRWHVPLDISFNPGALVQSGISFRPSLLTGVKFFSTLNISLECSLLGHYLHAFFFFFNSSDTIPTQGGGNVGFTDACMENNTIIYK